MSLDKIAKILHVDEVNIMHGPKGVALYVTLAKSQRVLTIDNEDLGSNKAERMKVIAENLLHLADAHVRGEAIRKASMEQPYEPPRRMYPTWDDVDFSTGQDRRQRQIQRSEPSYAPPPTSEPISQPTVSEPMESRFHAIMEELKGL